MQPASISIRFIFTTRDLLIPGLRVYVKRPVFWLVILMSVLCIALSFFLEYSYITLRAVGVISLVSPLLFFILSVFLGNRKLDNKEIRYNFSNERIEFMLPTGKQEQKWTTLVRIIIEKEHIMLFCSSQRAHVIPKRAFSGTGEIQAFTDLLSSKRPDLMKNLPA
jgi:hypothetical protein